MFLHSLTQISYKGLVTVFSMLIAFSVLTAVVVYAAFTAPINLTTNPTLSPVIDVDTVGVIHAVWEEVGATGSDIIYGQSVDDGVTFSNGSRINVSSAASLISTNPQIKIDSADNIYIVWEEDDLASGETEIYGVKSSNGGTSFSAKNNISNDSLYSGSAYIETSASDKVHVVWAKETVGGDQLIQVFYSSSTDGGANFSTPINISNSTHNLDKPIIRAKGSVVLVIWQAEGPDYGLYRVRSTDNGDNFGSATNFSQSTTVQVTDPAIGVDGNNRVHVVATVYNGTEPNIFYSRSTDEGDTFSAPENVSNTANDISADPDILAVGQGTIYIIWSENTCNGGGCQKSLLLRTSGNGGVTFGSATSPDALQVLSSVEGIDLDRFGLSVYMIWEQSGVAQFMKGSQ